MTRILLLSSAGEPITFINERRAISLLLRNVVDAISFWDNTHPLPWTGKDGNPVKMPATLRLTKWVRVSRKTSTPNYRRQVVFARDDYTCQYCFKELHPHEATIDHVIPKSKGGLSTWKNTVTACKTCNRHKGNCTLEQAGMKLHKNPTIPTIAHFWDIRHTDPGWNDSWDVFIPR